MREEYSLAVGFPGAKRKRYRYRQQTPGYEEQNAGRLRIRARCPPSLVLMFTGITCHQASGALWLSGTAFGSRFVQRRGTGAEV